MEHKLPELSFDYNALEPYIDGKTMEIHHTKHHQGYINKYVKALENEKELLEKDVEEVLKNLDDVPQDLAQSVVNNGGGYYNHRLFWTILSPEKTEMSTGLKMAIDRDFGSFSNFKEEFSTAAKTQFGSGWAWLVVKDDGSLAVTNTPNQNTAFEDGQPILALDVWEHAYYLNYQNRRPDYVENFWNIVNWKQVSEYFDKASK